MTITSGRAIVRHLGYWGDYRKGAAMNAIPPARGRRVKFTPQAIEKIKELVAEGLSRDEIANRLGVTVGSLQVTCSRLELFRPSGCEVVDAIKSAQRLLWHTYDLSDPIKVVRSRKFVSSPTVQSALQRSSDTLLAFTLRAAELVIADQSQT